MRRERKQRRLTRRQFIGRGTASAAALGFGLSGCAYDGLLEEDYPSVPENRVRLPENGRSVLILGGGFGGLHAACELLDRGFRVTVLEKSGLPGGKLKSWWDREFGVPPAGAGDWKGSPRDVGIHAVWGCYNNLREFMGRHGYTLYRYPNEATTMYHFLDRRGTTATMLSPPPTWPGMLGNFQRYQNMIDVMETMSGREIGMASYLRKMMSFDFDDVEQRMYLDSLSFPEWGRAAGMPEEVIYRIMGPFADMAMFDRVDDVSALSVMMMMQLLFGSYKDMCIDLFRHPAGETYAGGLADYIRSRGGNILYDRPVFRLNHAGGRIESVLAGIPESAGRWRCRICGESFGGADKPHVCPVCGAESAQIVRAARRGLEEFRADDYVVAMDAPGAQRLVEASELAGAPYFDDLLKLSRNSVYVVNIWYSGTNAWEDRFPAHWNIMPSGFRYLGFTLNWAMNGKVNGRPVVPPFVPQYQPGAVKDRIVVIENQLADTEKVAGLTDAEIVRRVHADLKTVFPALPEPADSYINKWHTYSPLRVGHEALRPTIASPVENLYFIGDWVRIDHLSVYMEKTNVSAKMLTNLLLAKAGQREGRIRILRSGTPNRFIDLCRRLFSVYPS